MTDRPTESSDATASTASTNQAEPTSAVAAGRVDGRVGARISADVPVLPTRAWADRDEAWGDRRDDDSNDERLLREKPPHWS